MRRSAVWLALMATFTLLKHTAAAQHLQANETHDGGTDNISSSALGELEPILTAAKGPARFGGSNSTAAPLEASTLSVDTTGSTATFFGFTPATDPTSFGSATGTIPTGIGVPWSAYPGAVGNFEGMTLNAGSSVTIQGFLNASLPSLRITAVSLAFLQATYLVGPITTTGTPNALATLGISFVLAGNTLTYTRPNDYTAVGTDIAFGASYLLGVCNPAEDCCDDEGNFHASTYICRHAAGPCDEPERCSGTSGGACPTDTKKGPGTPCRAATDCVQAASCTGTSGSCPAPVPVAGVCCDGAGGFLTTQCRAATDCVQAASCTGTSGSCPAPVPVAGVCCDGAGGFATSATQCRTATDCVEAARCTGSSGSCPDPKPLAGVCCDGAGGFHTSSTQCRKATSCVEAASCTGSSGSCPGPVPVPGLCCDGAGGFLPVGHLCRGAGGPCNVPEVCLANGICPRDKFATAGKLCRRPKSSCEQPSRCSGNGPACPKALRLNGRPCFLSQKDLGPDLFWPPESAQLSEKGQAQHPTEPIYYTSRRPDRYPSSGAYDMPEYDWPECFGTCFAGECRLDQSRPGCCYLQGRAYGSAANDAASIAEVSGGVGGYWEHAGGTPVCWRHADEKPYTV